MMPQVTTHHLAAHQVLYVFMLRNWVMHKQVLQVLGVEHAHAVSMLPAEYRHLDPLSGGTTPGTLARCWSI
jgi:hypothetical protein